MSEHVSIRPDEAIDGGGLIDDFDGVIAAASFMMTDYDGNLPNPVPCAEIKFGIDNEEPVPVYYSVGGDGDFAPDETGNGLIKLRSKSFLTKTCKFIMFMDSLVKSGFPLNRMDAANIQCIVGTKGHFLREAVEYKNLKKKSDRDNTLLKCTKIISLPGEGESGKAAAKGGKGGKKADVDTALADSVSGIIIGIIAEAGGEIAKKDLLTSAMKSDEVKGMEDKRAAMKLISDDTFLKSRDEWAYEGGILKVG